MVQCGWIGGREWPPSLEQILCCTLRGFNLVFLQETIRGSLRQAPAASTTRICVLWLEDLPYGPLFPADLVPCLASWRALAPVAGGT